MFPFPLLDCHAHIAPDVTAAQVGTLKGAQIFAMTRTLDEFKAARTNPQTGLLWGVGVHPGVPAALSQWSHRRFAAAVEQTVLIGEVGLDRRGDDATQRVIFEDILRTAPAALISVHSTGRARKVVELVEKNPHPGVMLHWFTGAPDDIQRAAAAGCFFSINAAMTDEQMTALPLDRVLPETDFPASRSRTGAKVPGDIIALEKKVARLTRQSLPEVRRRWYRNLSTLAERADVQQKLPVGLQQLISVARNG